MRHAKAEPAAVTDHARDLTAGGRRDAALAGEWLREARIVPDAALISSATRTTSTWQEVSSAAGLNCRLDSSDALYAAEPDSALDLIRSTADEVGTLIVIGHNPTMGLLAQSLDDGDGDVEASTGMIAGFPTCATAVFTFEGGWVDLAPGAARLASFHVPRGG
ncbi:SixA phosphatase family protein [Nocardioides jensenii]|uniref:SixA phosphatase family protein n=1 Tax=Nocardioides jensenii TaxID=1843 RepID=UPI000835B234|nr:phosphoglycerate mutase [Nocardioides jensenii]